MKIFGRLFIGIALISFFGCSNEAYDVSIVQDCPRIKDAIILVDGEGCCAVFGAAVYIYENDLYTVQGFCSCNDFLFFMTNNPVNCEGIELCDEEGFDEIQNCISELKFYENAEFLFNISL